MQLDKTEQNYWSAQMWKLQNRDKTKTNSLIRSQQSSNVANNVLKDDWRLRNRHQYKCLIVIQVFALQSIPRNHIMVATVTGYLNSWLFPDRNIISDQMSNASLQRDAFTLIRPHHQRVTRSRYTVTQTTATTLHYSLWRISAAFYDIKHKYYIQ